MKLERNRTMNDTYLRWIEVGLHKYLLGWAKEVDLQESYTALPKGLVTRDTLDCDIQNEPVYYKDII